MLSKTIKKLREENQITQKDLGKILGLSQQTIGHYETNRAQPDYETLNNMANYFNVTIDYLLGRTSKRKEAFYSRVDQEKILTAISDEPELLSIWNEIKDRDELKTMINQVKDLRPSSIKRIIRYIKLVEEEETDDNI